ncbi:MULTISPECIES: sulfotransferase [unclassified Mesorhizobium]|uniref:sulfotransferase family protein n=1 Tax=unclassified Mesorhizobium TaxID=325217 RepID=UPI000FD6DD87|nr:MULTISPECIES: sulfotransferase [unclassified Mesorhizobium]TGQ17329.1 sulfotransferase [Mesorhizobium sp. M2E.F.Ca.ET.219.01.1.1]TGT76514.1 sulfotransferase [Mesorhizobium sp. M2E.F.Ca.ET.166.01.1.1]TGW02628.1 sulfotransferase [Mesorhizobium sp. M2E.F.Ca.ET.154.01.1.1]
MVMRTGFICGCGHSGTTLIATILASHPDVYLPFDETNIFFKWTPLAMFRYWKLKLAANGAGKSLLLEKTPRHIRRVARIRTLVPGARFIMPVRDGRDVVASLTRRLGDPKEALDRWITDNGLVLAERGEPDVLIYRYEDLVEEPAKVVERICTFLDLAYSPDLLDYHKHPQNWFKSSGAQAEQQGHVALRNQQVSQPIYDGRGRWRSEVGDLELEDLMQGRGAQLMKEFGYR